MSSLLQRAIPRTAERLPVVGLGTYATFDVDKSQAQRTSPRAAFTEFVRCGGGMVDSSPMYGRSEGVVGDFRKELGKPANLFLATKVWTHGREAGIQQMERSLHLFGTERVDLIQIHNLLDWRVHLTTLRQWKEQGKIRYLGVTHYSASAYDELATVLETEDLDFVQLNYSLAEREAERRLLPLAAERGVAVIVNRPFAEAALFDRVRGKSLPTWATEMDCTSWAQFFLKFVVSHPAVTCAIPASSNATHVLENMQTGSGALPGAEMRERMVRYLVNL